MLHSEARDILKSAFQKVVGRAPTDQELGYCQAVAWLETLYGRGGQFSKLVAKGVFNWGALETKKGADGNCPPGTALGQDVGEVCFYAYPTDKDAALAFLSVLLTGSRAPGSSPHADVLAAMAGSADDVANAMKSHGYFGASVDQYAAAIRNAQATTSAPGGITDAGLVFRTPSPPGGQQPSQVAWYKKPIVLAGGVVAVLGAIVIAVVRRP